MIRKTRWILLAALFVAPGITGCDDDSSVNYASIDDPEPGADPNPTPNPEPEGEPEVPPEPEVEPEPEMPPGAPDGAACDDDDACAGGTCLPVADGYPEGHCTTTDCAEGNACTEGAQCAFLDSEREESACFALCGDGGVCREGYVCEAFGNVSLCQPEEPEEEMRADGEPCTDRIQCAGGVCFSEDDGFPGGHCTTINCETRVDCAGEGRACLQAGRPNYCIVLCESQRDCRDDYICQPIQGGGFCTPSPTAGNNVPEEGDLPFDLVCGDTFAQSDAFQGGLDRHELTFELPDDTTSFMIVPYSAGDQIFPVQLEGPGGTLDMFNEYGFALANAQFMINLSPILVPQAPQFADFVGGGEHVLTMAANSDLCRYVIPKNDLGSQIDLNIHLVGVRGFDAQTAQDDAGFQRALARFDEIYASVGTQIRLVRYLDVAGEDATRFRVVRSQEAAFQLVAISEAPGETKDEALSVNVFFIDQFAIQGGSVLGISSGLPGAAGIHGARGSGLVFAASVLGDPDLLGQVLAHEVGHYLGLFHTTEQGGRGFDPLQDTPQCGSNQWNNPNGCPDINNLMFPFAGNSHTEISDNQDSVLHANPLIK